MYGITPPSSSSLPKKHNSLTTTLNILVHTKRNNSNSQHLVSQAIIQTINYLSIYVPNKEQNESDQKEESVVFLTI